MSNTDQSNQNWLTVLSKAMTAVVFDLTGTYTSHGWSTAYRRRRHFAPTDVCLRSRMGCHALVDRSTPRSYRMDAIGRKLSRRDVYFKNTPTRRAMLLLRKPTRIWYRQSQSTDSCVKKESEKWVAGKKPFIEIAWHWSVFHVVRFIARLSSPFHGHDEMQQLLSRGVFLELISYLADNGNSPVAKEDMHPLIDMNPAQETCIYSTLLFVHRQNRHSKWNCLSLASRLSTCLGAGLDIVCQLGGFHLLMIYLGCIGRDMDGSGLEEMFLLNYGPNTVHHMLYRALLT